MMWLSKTTTKWLTADLKFKEAKEKKEEAAEKKADAPADGDADEDADADADDSAAPSDSKLMKALEFAAWGL
jgi:hypothetical protein